MQCTIAKPIEFSGIGLHSGKVVKMRLSPASPNTGIIFFKDMEDRSVKFDVKASNVTDTMLCTSLKSSCGEKIATVEHLMSALHGFGIDNVIVTMDAAEVPIMDGSSKPFAFLIKEAGIQTQSAPRKYIKVLKQIHIEDGDKFVTLSPSSDLEIDFSIDFNSPAIEETPQRLKVSVNPSTYEHISLARTFGFMKEIEMLQSQGLCRGGSLDNAIVLDDYKVLNPNGLRVHDEFVRHKILDAIGDFYMEGLPIIASIRAHKSGHHLNNVALNALISQADAWAIVHESECNERGYVVEDKFILAT
ncbi:UDP-3-O-acyl-N-acetylglucosamine deacetylase [Vibrio owensii]|uniref:UDP-3-O-acyl-N-acetylglucosamine deacetylase n=1 Tax=Vibrio harveyi group TaxID=717610 RepID=UPI003CC6B931